MKKPTKQKIEYYDYSECRDYLEQKYGYDERDYAGKFKDGLHDDRPYLDFWHWVVERFNVRNGDYITFERSEIEEIEQDWVREIYTRYIDEFADKNGNLEMYVGW